MESSSPSNKLSWIVLLCSMLIGGIISIYLGKELTYDVENYHYFAPYAFLHNRWNIDYWPSTYIEIFRNPTLDFVTYFLLTFFSPLKAAFILGCIHGLNIWIIFQLIYRFVAIYDKKHLLLLTFILTFAGIYGPVSFTEMGSFMGDNFITIFILAALLLQVIGLQRYSPKHLNSMLLTFCSGLILGMGFGLKLTAGIFLPGFFVAYLFLPGKVFSKIKLLIVWGLGVSLGFLSISSYWMLFLWERYHNPFFPLFNKIFHSPYFYNYNWHDQKFLPIGLMKNLFFPVYFSWKTLTYEIPFTDYRLLIVYILSFITLSLFFYNKYISPIKNTTDNVLYRWLILFFIFSYATWQYYFAITRYIDTLLMLAPLIIYLLITKMIRNDFYRFTVLSYLLVFITITMMPIVIKRRYPFGNDYFNINLSTSLNKQQKATVLSAFTELSAAIVPPTFYLQPFFPSSWQYINIPYRKEDKQYYLPDKVRQLVKESSDTFYLLADEPTMVAMYQAAHELGLEKSGDCAIITSDPDPQGIFLCPVKSLNS